MSTRRERQIDLPRVILHVDMDAFYAAVEVREDPSLAGKPLIIGHRGRRGVVSTCSYEARRYGVHSAMPSVTAERLCPQATWLPGRMSLYASISREIHHLFDDFTPVVEKLSIDEAFLDLTGIASDLEGGRQVALKLKQRIRDDHRLSASVGVAPNKFLAKLASDMDKPDGLVIFRQEDVAERLWPMPVERMWGVGPKSAARLKDAGVEIVHDLLRIPERHLVELVGRGLVAHLLPLARGEDFRSVVRERRRKSISEERTYTDDLVKAEAIDRALLERAEGVARDLRRKGLVGRTVHIKVRTGDFTTWTRSHTLSAYTDQAEVIVRVARSLFERRIELGGKGVRLLGLGISGLERGRGEQGSLFGDPQDERRRRLTRAADELRERLGHEALVRARFIERPDGDADDGPEEITNLPAVD